MCSSASQSRATQPKTAWLCIVCSHQRLTSRVCGNCAGVHCTGCPSHLKIWRCHIISLLSFLGKVREHQVLISTETLSGTVFFWTVLYFRRILERAKQPAQHFVCLSHRTMDLIMHQGTCFSSSIEIPSGSSHGKHTGGRSVIPWEWQLLQRAKSRPWESFQAGSTPIP